MTVLRVLLLILSGIVLRPAEAEAHALQPGYLEIAPIAGDSYRIYWRRPDVQGSAMAIDARLPDHCDPVMGPAARFDGSAWVSVWVASCPAGLPGGTIAIEGLEKQRTDVLVRYRTGLDQARAERLTPENSAFTIPETPDAFDVIRSYVPLGVEHILAGLDHLLFVFALLLLIPDRWRLVGAITAFTLAHSITMAAATLGWVALPGPPVEAIIALSIMFVASELVRRDGSNQRLSERFPWTVSFTFGLLHGFGFAGALQEIGLPQSDVPLALLSFNIGVEIGQLVFVVAILLAAYVLRRAWPVAASFAAAGTRGSVVSAYAIGGISAYWFLDRLSGF